MKLEREITREIIAALRERGCAVLKVVASPMQPMAVDLYGCRRSDGRCVVLEVKTARGRLTPRQGAVLAQWAQAGAITGVVRSTEEALVLLFGSGG